MDQGPSPAHGSSRRGFLRGAAGLVGGLGAAGLGIAGAVAAPTPTVLTWNVYLGVDLDDLLGATTLADVRAIAGEMLAEVDPALYEARAAAIAEAIEASDPDVLALQEATLLRTQSPSDFGEEDASPAETVLVDFLEMILTALEDRGLAYEPAATTVTTDVELPADAPEGTVDLRITDRDALLVRGDHDSSGAVTETYDAFIPFPIPGTRTVIALRRGYCRADVVVDADPFVTVSTHLESVSADVRAQQATELLAALPEDRPVVLCGDINSGPGSRPATYDLLTESFRDAHATHESGSDGATCCQPADLTSERSRLDRRFDAVLYRGGVGPVEVGRVGHELPDRVRARRDGEAVRLWPSDHAGVVATLELPEQTPTPTEPPTSTPTPTPTPTATATPSPTEEAGPGLGILGAVAGLAGYGLARLRLSSRQEE